MIVKLPDKSAKSVMAAFETLLDEYGEHFGGIFKIITTDNGSKFADLSNLEKAAETLYTIRIPTPSSVESATTGLFGVLSPKGSGIDSYIAEDFFEIELWCNSLPRKILGYYSTEEIFSEELDKIYSLGAA